MVNNIPRKLNKFLKENKNRLCKCGCGKMIKLQRHHMYYGIPEFSKGHFPWTEERKKKLRIANLGKIPSIKTREKWSQIRKGKLLGDKNPSKSLEVRKKLSLKTTEQFKNGMPKETREKLRKIRQNQILQNGGILQLGKNEKQIIDKWENIIGHKIIRQHPVCGYFLDGYCKELNIAFEVDESFHKKQRKKDIKRQQNIENELGCAFIREEDNFQKRKWKNLK